MVQACVILSKECQKKNDRSFCRLFFTHCGRAVSRWQHGALCSCALSVYTAPMRNITLSATDQLIDQAREKARAQGVSLNDEFRKWLASYVQDGNPQDAVARFRSVMQAMPAVDAGRTFGRDEMNER